jgi:hypothetical protein
MEQPGANRVVLPSAWLLTAPMDWHEFGARGPYLHHSHGAPPFGWRGYHATLRSFDSGGRVEDQAPIPS